MNLLDIIILVILALSAIGGLKDGFLKKLITIIGLILALFFATSFAGAFSRFLMRTFGFSYVLSLAIFYIFIFLTVGILSGYIHKKIVDASSVISVWDKIGGAVLGIFETVIILSLFFLFFNLINFPPGNIREHSFFYSPIYNFAPSVFNYVKDLIPGAGDFFREFKLKI